MKSDDNSMERCPVCKGNISNMDAKLKEDHLNKCFNNVIDGGNEFSCGIYNFHS